MSRIVVVLLLFVCTNVKSEQTISLAFSHQNQGLLQIIEGFTQRTGIQVEARSIDNSELKIELLQRSASKSLPDAVLVPGDFLGMKDLQYSEVASSLIHPDTHPRFTQSAKVDGLYLGIPIIAGNHLLLYYNQALVPKAASTWPEMQEQQRLLWADKAPIAWSFNEMYWLVPFITAMQTTPLEGNVAQLNSKAMQHALTFYWDLARQGTVNSQCDYQCATQGFVDQQLPYLISGFWAYTGLVEKLGDKLGIAPLPSINGHAMRSYFSAHVLAFPGKGLTGKKRLALLALADYMQSLAVQQRLWSLLQALPVNGQVLNAITSQASANISMVIKQLNQSEPLPNSLAMAIVWEAMLIGFKRYGGGIVDAPQATLLMQHLAEQSINNMQSGP